MISIGENANLGNPQSNSRHLKKSWETTTQIIQFAQLVVEKIHFKLELFWLSMRTGRICMDIIGFLTKVFTYFFNCKKPNCDKYKPAIQVSKRVYLIEDGIVRLL